MKNLLLIFLSIICSSLFAQEAPPPIYDDLVFELDSLARAYKPTSGKNYAFVKAKRGTGGVNKTSKADSIVGLSITDIVLVFSEYSDAASAKREEGSRERWENLLKTYPQLFQYETNYLNMVQYTRNIADTLTFKSSVGFYIYFKGKEQVKVEAAKVEEKKPANTEVADTKKVKSKKSEEVAEEKPKKEKPAKEEKPKKEEVAKKETKAAEIKETVVATEEPEDKPKKVGYLKPKKSKDPKACRPPCYEGGDEDLFAFFRDNIKLTKKEKRHSGDLVTVLRIQLNFDGSIKKTFLIGTNTELNKQVEEAVNSMGLWNPAVKGGVTIKSEIKMTLKYDHDTHAMKPFETTITPRPGPKCLCVSDSELFGE